MYLYTSRFYQNEKKETEHPSTNLEEDAIFLSKVEVIPDKIDFACLLCVEEDTSLTFFRIPTEKEFEHLKKICPRTPTKEKQKRMTYIESLLWIESRARFGMKLGLENTKKMLELLGNPQKKVPCIHIAGTNGKGSVSTYVSYVLEEANYKVGLFTSPFIETFRERFQINHQAIPEDDMIFFVKRIREIVDCMEKENKIPTHFEILTAMAFDYFAREKVDFAVMEVGLGGLYDATNVIENPLASLIVTIDYDHTDILGDTLAKIAEQKAGIIKKNCPVFVYPNPKEAMDTIQSIAKEKSSPLFTFSKDMVEIRKIHPQGTDFTFQNNPYHLSMIGEHQAYNASLAILTLKYLEESGILHLGEALQKGLGKAKIIARLEQIGEIPKILLDGSHNLQGILALEKALKYFEYDQLILGLAILKDKDFRHMVKHLPKASMTVVTEVNSPRKLPAEDLAKELPGPYMIEKDLEKAFILSLSLAKENDLVLWCGSLYLMGDIRKNFFSKKSVI